ncbi:nonribosomal peptide synthetase MxaA [Hyphomicrobium methylovorum]|nr:nonribosomal peptide synthetase MxaA [Hyphomicrobium methylovorum]
MRKLATILFLLLFPVPVQAAIEAVNIFEPRAFGYFMGDTLERRVEVVTTGDTELISGSLPRPGSLTYWLDLTSVDHSVREAHGAKTHTIILKYQIFYSALQATKLKIPPYPLKFRNPGVQPPADGAKDEHRNEGEAPPASASIPALQLTISPLRDILLDDVMPDRKTEISEILRPDARANLIPTGRLEKLLGLSAAALLLSLALLLWHYAIWPFSRRAGRPFTIADRRIRKLQSASSSDDRYAESLLVLHRALDEAHGGRVFAGDLPNFISKHERFSDLSLRLREFFESSRMYFFSGDKAAAESRFSVEDVRHLVADLAREEKAA